MGSFGKPGILIDQSGHAVDRYMDLWAKTGTVVDFCITHNYVVMSLYFHVSLKLHMNLCRPNASVC